MAEYSFGPFTVDTTSARLARDGTDVRLRPRAFQTLRVLLQHGGESVGYERMIAEAWEGTHVSRHTVDVTVAEVRKSLGEYGRWITHRPKVGYALEIPRSDELVRTGWHFWNQRTRDGCERAIDAFSRAIAECRADFRAFEGLSASYMGLAVFGMRPPREMYPRFLEAHNEAVALGGLRPELRCNRAYGLHIFERDYPQAEAEFLKTIEERPTLPLAYVRLARMYGGMKRFDDAIETLQRGYKVDPLLPTLPATEVLVRVWQRDYDRAIELGTRAVELHPYLQVVRSNFGQALEGAGRLQDALTQYQTAAVMSPDLPWLRALQGAVLAKLDRITEARAILDELETLRQTDYVDAYHMAILRRALGETDRACDETRRAVDDNSAWLFTLDVDPNMDGIRAHPESTNPGS